MKCATNTRHSFQQLAAAVVAGLSVACLAAAAADNTGGSQNAPDPGLEKPLRQLLIELQVRHLLPTEKAAAREVLLDSLLSTFRTGGRVVRAEQADAEARSALGPLHLLKDRFAYLQVRRVEADLPAELEQHRDREPLAEDESGVIIDLRGAAGNDMTAISAAVKALADWDRPLAVLIDGDTRAGGEMLARQLRDALGCVLIGTPTRGLPYPLRSVDLGDGVTVMLPDIPAQANPEPIVPDVSLEGLAVSTPRSSDAPKPGSTQALYRDESVRKAVDLLTAICAFRQKHF